MFHNVIRKVDYILLNTGEFLGNLLYIYPESNDSISGFHYINKSCIHACPVLPAGELKVIGHSYVVIMCGIESINTKDSKLVVDDYHKEIDSQESLNAHILSI